ncbi:MAG TPA: flagellar filament capping protein FliD [Steroidobacteraceae bacterium]|nr:flagellar filament capping protein FliD [Steroidobacteraceae bacterium]
MAGLSSPGLGSGLDINSLVSQLVAAEKAPAQAQLTRSQTATVTTISALGSLKGALGAFNAALTPLKSLESFSARSATASDVSIFTASATNAASQGSYDIQVESLASAHQLTSDPFVSGAGQVVGTGTLTIASGENSFQVNVDASHNTLAQIRDAINQATGNEDLVRATIVNAADGAHLVLSAVATGEDAAITVAQSDGDGGLASLVYNPTLTTNYAQQRAAADSVVYIAGFEHHSATNTIDDAIEGVSITLLDAEPGETFSLTIANDTNATTGRIKNFVDQYNALAKTIGSLRSYEPATKRAGPLLGDAMLRGIETELRSKLTGTASGITGPYQTLASVGITTEKDGTLKLDAAKLNAAMASNYDGVASLFGSANGVAARMSDALTPRLATDSELDVRTKRLNQRSVSLQKDQAALEARMLKVESRYRAQFTALDSLLSKLQNTSAFLEQQLSSIANISKRD